jgi:hypothetical protein
MVVPSSHGVMTVSRSPRGSPTDRPGEIWIAESDRTEADHSRCLSWEAGVSPRLPGRVDKPME